MTNLIPRAKSEHFCKKEYNYLRMSNKNKSLIPKEKEVPQRKPARLEGVVQNRGIKNKKKERKPDKVNPDVLK